jgi:hypothetical protein
VRKLRRLTALLGISPLRGLIWNFYADLKIYRANPSKSRRLVLRARFDRIFRRRTGFVTLDRLLKRLHANKAELLMVLERPEIPLHTNGSENDIRCQVTRRKVSAGTRSDAGRDCRDAFLGLAKTCAKHGVAFWDYLGSRPQSSRAACRSAPGGPCPLPRATGLIPTAARRFAGVTHPVDNPLLLQVGLENFFSVRPIVLSLARSTMFKTTTCSSSSSRAQRLRPFWPFGTGQGDQFGLGDAVKDARPRRGWRHHRLNVAPVRASPPAKC